MKIVAKTDKGMVRDSNQDAYAVGELPGEVAWAVVCDGIFIGDAIQSIGYSKEDIKEILKSKNISAENVFLMTVDCRGNSILIMREAEK